MADTSKKAKFLIRKQGHWYNPNEARYTSSAIHADRYTYDDAVKLTHPNGLDGHRDGMSFISEDIVLCQDWRAFRAMRAKRDTLRADLAEAQREIDDLRTIIDNSTTMIDEQAWIKARAEVAAAEARAESARADGYAQGVMDASVAVADVPNGANDDEYSAAILALLDQPQPDPMPDRDRALVKAGLDWTAARINMGYGRPMHHLHWTICAAASDPDTLDEIAKGVGG